MTDKIALFNDVIKEFPRLVVQELRCLIETGGVLKEVLVKLLIKELGIDIKRLMIKLLPLAAIYAEVPISNFNVGVVARGIGDPGCLYFGANIEFSGQALSFCVHAEQSAFTNAWIHGEKGLQALAINAAPCGYCRQFLYELDMEKQLEILLQHQDSNEIIINKMIDILPGAFGPKDLGITGNLMKRQDHRLSIKETSDELAVAALNAANESYSPYSKNYAGVALKGRDGRIYTGRYVENAAYNPSMSPLQSALAFMIINRNLFKTIDIEDAVLVENKSPVSQLDATRSLLSSITSIPLRYYKARL